MMTPALITADELAAILSEPDLRIIDGSWWLDGRDARADYESAHIPGAVFVDMDEVSDRQSPLPHTLPAAEDFAEVMGHVGISNNHHIVVYDTQGLFSAARIRWLLKVFGARHVQILDGGLPVWRSKGYPVTSGVEAQLPQAVFSTRLDESALATLEDVRAALGTETQILDARGAPRFNATVPEPRPGVRAGHMPGALNLPYGRLLNEDGTIKSGPRLEAAFKEVGVDFDKPVITSCGSGVTAAILTLGLELLGKPSRLYDGSWSEWGGRTDTPIEP